MKRYLYSAAPQKKMEAFQLVGITAGTAFPEDLPENKLNIEGLRLMNNAEKILTDDQKQDICCMVFPLVIHFTLILFFVF